MMLAILTYGYTVLSSIASMLTGLFIILSIVLFIMLLVAFSYFVSYGWDEDDLKKAGIVWRKTPKKTILALFMFMLLIPDSSQMKLIIGAYIAQSAVQVKGVNELPENVVKALNTFLQDVAKGDGDKK